MAQLAVESMLTCNGETKNASEHVSVRKNFRKLAIVVVLVLTAGCATQSERRLIACVQARYRDGTRIFIMREHKTMTVLVLSES